MHVGNAAILSLYSFANVSKGEGDRHLWNQIKHRLDYAYNKNISDVDKGKRAKKNINKIAFEIQNTEDFDENRATW